MTDSAFLYKAAEHLETRLGLAKDDPDLVRLRRIAWRLSDEEHYQKHGVSSGCYTG